MNRHKKHLLQDILLLVVGIGFAVYITKTGIVGEFVTSFGAASWMGIVLAGIFFTSVFTTPASIALLSEFAHTTPLPMLAILGGMGAVLGDCIIFFFVKDRVSEDFNYLFSKSKESRFSHIFKRRLFRFFIPFLGALIIASPLPDEIGITMLGMAKIRSRIFFLVSFIMNTIGILIIGLIAKLLM